MVLKYITNIINLFEIWVCIIRVPLHIIKLSPNNKKNYTYADISNHTGRYNMILYFYTTSIFESFNMWGVFKYREFVERNKWRNLISISSN